MNSILCVCGREFATSPIAVALAHKEQYVGLPGWLARGHAVAATEHDYLSEAFALKDVRQGKKG